LLQTYKYDLRENSKQVISYLEQESDKIIGIWEILPKVNINGIGFYAGKYSFENKCYDFGIGLIDCAIIYATMESKSVLWTIDQKILKHLGPEYIYVG
jgi:hypothetical protein